MEAAVGSGRLDRLHREDTLIPGGSRQQRRERRLGRVARRLEPLIGAGEHVRTFVPLYRRVRPLYPLLVMSLGVAIAPSVLGSDESAVPEWVRLAVGVPMIMVGLGVLSLTGPVILALSEGTVYIARRNGSRLIADAPLSALRVDLHRGRVEVGKERLWPPPGRRSSLRQLADAAEAVHPGGAAVVPETGDRRTRRRIVARIAAIVAVLLGALVVIGIVAESDEDAIEERIAAYGTSVRAGRAAEACEQLTARARAELVETATAFSIGSSPAATCAEAVETLAPRAGASGPSGSPPVLGVRIAGDRAVARVGAPFAYQRIPLERDGGEWRIGSTRAPAVLRDAPADEPPSTVEYGVRLQAICLNNLRRYVPVGLRLVDSTEGGRLTAASVGLLRTLGRQDRALADELLSLTPAPGARIELVADALRDFARGRDRLASGVAGRDREAAARASEATGRAQQAVPAAAAEAGLERFLGGCL